MGEAARLVAAVQALSLARDVWEVGEIVRTTARALAGADGATFVLRDGDQCYYADEDAIEPLWKGRRFPMAACVSGWVMTERRSAVIEDVYADARVPTEAYRPTFVRSLAMVPIRTAAPIGAIGNYWAKTHAPTEREVALLQALADSTSVALENVELREAQRQKGELFALVAHDLKQPASVIRMRAELRLQGSPPEEAPHWRSVLSSADHINRMAHDLLDVARSESGRLVPKMGPVRLGAVLADLAVAFTGRVTVADPEELRLRADEELLRRLLFNLVDNALRYAGGEVRVEARAADGEAVELTVADHGPGIPPADRERVFERDVRLAPDGAQPGRGLGLTFCRLAAEAHGGRIWIEDNPPRGSRFHVRLPRGQ